MLTFLEPTKGRQRQFVFSGDTVPAFITISIPSAVASIYEGWNFNSGNYLFTTDTK